ncbi:MAG: hypothetical protein OXG35_26790 [Acidobacteria bacterium]|nr:hypothetical protein [Acidobacteriota bacterium]
MEADVALLQEPSKVPPEVAHRVEIEPPDHWEAWDACRSPELRPFNRPRIAKLSDRVKVDWFKPVPLVDPISADEIAISDPHTVAAARVTPLDPESAPFIVVSLYAHWKSPHPSIRRENAIMSDLSAHRIISDLSTFVADPDREPHRVLAGGDLNMDYGGDYGWRQHGDQPLMYARCRTVWHRMEALGFEYLGPRHPNGWRADPIPEHQPADTKNVRTHYRSKKEFPASAPLQLDHVFASRRFHESIETRALNGVDEWGPSDHCRLLIDVRG